ncbi:MAG: hypothetical protein JWN05_2929 [Arthrobacter sp.]|nr:hypothetical protein [Arthrobacter sp.]
MPLPDAPNAPSPPDDDDPLQGSNLRTPVGARGRPNPSRLHRGFHYRPIARAARRRRIDTDRQPCSRADFRRLRSPLPATQALIRLTWVALRGRTTSWSCATTSCESRTRPAERCAPSPEQLQAKLWEPPTPVRTHMSSTKPACLRVEAAVLPGSPFLAAKAADRCRRSASPRTLKRCICSSPGLAIGLEPGFCVVGGCAKRAAPNLDYPGIRAGQQPYKERFKC